MSTIWIASYPKSGNTWLRFMLYAAIYGPPKHSADVSAKIQDIHRKMPTDLDPEGPTYIKTHYELTDQHPKLNDTRKAIHIIRNPRDVLLSTLNYRKLADDGSLPVTTKVMAKSFIKFGGDPAFAQNGFGTWASNARSWRTTTRFPVLQLRYEELKADPKAQLIKLLDFLEFSRTDSEIEQALSASSFDSMRAMEIREKQADPSNNLNKNLFVGTKNATRKGVYFMNKGKSNQSLDTITPGLDAQFTAAFKDDLQEFGYESA
ncbi:MAG: sulfotransferase domain-containing protein [Phycisphaerales bacterium]|nr:sulfotransferase domain-containing protein [Phycisphaerales bacterium]